MTKSEQFIKKLERNWQAIALSTVCICLVMVIIAAVQARTAEAFSCTDWGLSFGVTGAAPRGNVSSEELKQYNAYYIGNTEKKTIYLTFDAGYENGYTPQILDTLKEKNVPAAFFVVSHYIDSAPELIQRMANEGHIVANHTASHPDMSKLTDAEALRAELVPVEEKYKALTGQEMKKFYRPPQGKFSAANLQQAQELGYTTVFWSLAYVDWNTNNQPDAAAALQKLNSRIHNGAIVLLHSTSATNAEILGTLIDGWRAQGYEFASLEDLTAPS